MTARLHRGGHAVRHARRELIRAAGGHPRCARCGGLIDTTLPGSHPRGLVVGHVVAVSNGGADHRGNLQAEHNDCNRIASNRRDAIPNPRSARATIVPPIFLDEGGAGLRPAGIERCPPDA